VVYRLHLFERKEWPSRGIRKVRASLENEAGFVLGLEGLPWTPGADSAVNLRNSKKARIKFRGGDRTHPGT